MLLLDPLTLLHLDQWDKRPCIPFIVIGQVPINAVVGGDSSVPVFALLDIQEGRATWVSTMNPGYWHQSSECPHPKEV